jgi:GAF domain-containing protein
VGPDGNDVDIPDEVRLREALTELSIAVLTAASLRADLERLARIACELIPNCSGASVSMMVDGEPSSVAVTDHVALELDMVQYRHDDGPCITALGGEAVRIGFLPEEERFPHFAVGAADRRVLSVLSTPAIDHGDVVGSLNVYSRMQEAFDEHDRQTGLVMAGEIASALVKSAVLSDATGLRDRLQEQHDTTLMVARAQGVMMAVQDCSAAQADDLIRAAADDNREPIIRTAERIVASVQADNASLEQPSTTTGD